MTVRPGRSSLVPLCMSGVLLGTPALAVDEELRLSSPEPGEVRTEVTGQGAQTGIAWPDGPAAMTPRWFVADAEVTWACAKGPALRLEVRTERGPDSKPRAFNLRADKRFGGTSQVPLYLWPVEDVKAACAKDGEARVESTPVHLTLQCPGGRRVTRTQTVALQARCRPSEPSREAVTGISGSETERPDSPSTVNALPKFAHVEPSPDPATLLVGKRVTVKLGSAWPLTPAVRSLRPVQLDEAGKVLERHEPCRLVTEGGGGLVRCEPRVTLTPQQAGTLRFAFEAEYPDGSRLLSASAPVTVETPQARAAEEARAPTPEQRKAVMDAVTQKLATRTCGPDLVPWLKQQPHVEDAGGNSHNLWLRFSDGEPFVISCH
ncbi:hypothetical protein P2318_13765 [Myxococcaceae bacterium GXIMD 01537]